MELQSDLSYWNIFQWLPIAPRVQTVSLHLAYVHRAWSLLPPCGILSKNSSQSYLVSLHCLERSLYFAPPYPSLSSLIPSLLLPSLGCFFEFTCQFFRASWYGRILLKMLFCMNICSCDSHSLDVGTWGQTLHLTCSAFDPQHLPEAQTETAEGHTECFQLN